MAQIAQQDNLVIEVTTTAAALDSDTKRLKRKSAMHVLLVGWLTQPGIPQNTQLILLTQTAEQ